ncbi:MAG TPA: hypothetical protein VF980_04495 [Thermoanaerobaculia bacterium]
MRRALYWIGWAILFSLPLAFTIEIIVTQDLPAVQAWKWAILAGAVLLTYFARNRDDVLHHHLA